MRTSAQRSRLFLTSGGLTAAVVGLDVLSKSLAEEHLRSPVQLVLGAELSLSHNSGMAFGALSGAPDGIILVVVAICVGALAAALIRGWLPAGALTIGLLTGGALANVVDRGPDGRITDFIDLPYWPAFNIADMAITLAVVGLLVGFAAETNADRPDAAAV